MTTYKDIHPSEWDREARLVGRLAMIEHVIAALITDANAAHLKMTIEMKLDMMFGRNPPGELNKATEEIAYGAEEVADYFLKVCDNAKGK